MLHLYYELSLSFFRTRESAMPCRKEIFLGAVQLQQRLIISFIVIFASNQGHYLSQRIQNLNQFSKFQERHSAISVL